MRLSVLILAVTALSCASPSDDAALVAQLTGKIDAIVAEYPEAVVSVAVRDSTTGVRYDREPARPYHAASTMKVPVLIEVFRQAEAGRLSLDDSLRVRNEFRSIVDGSPFSIEDDSYDGLYGRLGSLVPVRELAEYMITWSSNLATNLLIQAVGADSVQATSERLGTSVLKTLRGVEDLKAFEAGLNNTTTAEDLALLLEALAEGRAVSPSADRAMIEMLLRQEFNDMIPAGLPEGVLVAHKTGNITRIHHDAAVVYPPESGPYVLVILIEGLEQQEVSAALGSRIARSVHETIRPPG